MRTDNTLPSGIHDLLRLAGQMADGLTLHGPFLKITQTPADDFCALLERLREAETRLAEARVAQALAGKESTAADAALNRWLVHAKLLLTVMLGRTWSARWQEAGFTNGRQSVPKRMEPRIALARTLIGFLKCHPDFEAAATQITGERAEEVLGRMLAAQTALRDARVECITRKRRRDALEQALRRKMRQVVVILGVTIRAHDERWLAFGLNRPARAGAARRSAPPTGNQAEVIALPPQSAPAAEPLRQATAA